MYPPPFYPSIERCLAAIRSCLCILQLEDVGPTALSIRGQRFDEALCCRVRWQLEDAVVQHGGGLKMSDGVDRRQEQLEGTAAR